MEMISNTLSQKFLEGDLNILFSLHGEHHHSWFSTKVFNLWSSHISVNIYPYISEIYHSASVTNVLSQSQLEVSLFGAICETMSAYSSLSRAQLSYDYLHTNS